MSTVSISQAARMAGVSRANLYKTYIDKGVLSVTKDDRDRPAVDVSELRRVFPSLKAVTPGDSPKVDTKRQELTEVDDAEKTRLQEENARLRAQLADSQERERQAADREAWMRGQVDKLTDVVKLLEGPKAPVQDEKKPGLIARLFGQKKA